jgi:D-serine deaminase-like pyridoxal phosphate-dependent protein
VYKRQDVALSVLASVIGHQKEKGWVITDSGWTALSGDRGTASHKIDQGYGLVCAIDGTPYPDLIVTGANQEHGIISSHSANTIPWEQFEVGQMVRILPNHACATGANFEQYHIVDGGIEIMDVWQRVNGW